MFKVFNGAKETMESIAKKGVRGINMNTHKWQFVDKEAKYAIMQDNGTFWLMSDKDLLSIAKQKRLAL